MWEELNKFLFLFTYMRIGFLIPYVKKYLGKGND